MTGRHGLCPAWQRSVACGSMFGKGFGYISKGAKPLASKAAIATMEALANLDHTVRGMAENTRLRLTTQARLQHARKTGEPAFELRPLEPGQGFDLLPEPQPGDIFDDIEGES